VSVSLTPEAEADLAEAYAWYQRRRRGLGDEFLQSVDAALAAIQHLPESYPLVHHDNRRVLVRRFPYALFYQAMGGEILVVGCFHAARNPEGWRAGD
jgi:plasmid stabilization system protein ParE